MNNFKHFTLLSRKVNNFLIVDGKENVLKIYVVLKLYIKWKKIDIFP